LLTGVVAWVSERTGRALGRRYTILFATLNIVVLVLTVLYVGRFDPALTWTEPILLIAFWVIIRAAIWFVNDVAGFNE